MGWFANVFLVVGLWMVGNKARWAFILTAVGEAIWTVTSILRGQFDLAFICVVFTILAIRNWFKWGN